jgi:hypothetical protein
MMAGGWTFRFSSLTSVGSGFIAADDGGQLALHHAHQGLARRQAADDFLAKGLFLDAGNEVAHDRQRHVGFEHGKAHFAQHLGGVGLGQSASPRMVLTTRARR